MNAALEEHSSFSRYALLTGLTGLLEDVYPFLLFVFIIWQSSFSQYAFLSDYLTDLKLHRTK